MKFVGFIVGLIVGAMFGSVETALALAVLGAIAGALWFDKDKTPPAPAQSSAPSPSAQTPGDMALRISRLEKRVDMLERQLRGLDVPEAEDIAPAPVPPMPAPAAPGPAPVPAPAVVLPAAMPAQAQASVAAQPAVQPPPVAAPKPAPRPAPPPPPPPVPLRERLPKPIAQFIFGGNMLVKAGVLILFLGLAFLLRYTAERVTVPIEMRYASVALVGAVLLVLGWLLRRRRPDYALVVQGAGIGVFYLTTMAAMKLHGLLPPEIGFAFLFGVAVLSAILAVLQNASVLAIVAALEGFAAPVLASTGQNNPVGLFGYLLVLDIGILLVAWFRAWRVLNLIGAVGTFTLAAAWANKYYTDAQHATVQPFLVVFFLLFVLVGFLFARRTLADIETEEDLPLSTRAMNMVARVGRVDSALAFGVPMAAYGLQYLMLKPYPMGPAFAALGFSAFYLLAGRWVWRTQPRGLSLLAEAYAIVGVIFATLAIPLGLEGQWTGAAWAVEAAGMYWLGVRQQRPYARAFAFAVLAGAVFKLLQATQWDGAPGHALIEGSWIGPLLVAGGAFAMWFLHRRGKLDRGPGLEALAGLCLPWLGMAALTLLLWQTLLPGWAAMATALLAAAAFVLAQRFALGSLVPVCYGMQVLAVASFIATLEHGTGEQVLASGWEGLLQSLWIALSILLSIAWPMRAVLQQADTQEAAPVWSVGQLLAGVVGVAMLHLAMLFQISAAQAALVWPLSASLVLWIALRIGHPALAASTAALQIVSALLCWEHWERGFQTGDHVGTFSSLGFWSALAIGLAALWCGDRLRGASRTRNPWSAFAAVLWLPVVWGLLWALGALLSEVADALLRANKPNWIPSVRLGVVLLASVLAAWVAQRRHWLQLARASAGTLPAMVLLTFVGWGQYRLFNVSYIPFDGIGWLVWPLAAAWHLRLLAWQEKWFTPARLAALHVAGVWFFLFIAARECKWLLGQAGDAWSSWQLLGWVIAPALALWALQWQALLQRWPLTTHRLAYARTAAWPVAVYLLLWAWISNLCSSGNADPLPYVPLLNPLELSHWLILGGLFAWWSRVGPGAQQVTTPAKAVFGLTGLALLTGMVLRSCHHFADVPWDWDALFESRLTQAALSITWAASGVALMVLGHARAKRALWVAGASLLGIVVLKLFFIELADQGGLFRIVSFLSVGVLLLAVGYFAPVPPAKAEGATA